MATAEIALRSAASMAEKVEYCRLLADSGLLPDSYRGKPANVLYAIEYGDTLGITPMAAITGVHVIKGKPSASAALISGLVRRAGHKLRVSGDALSATAQIIRSDDPDFVFEASFTIEDARRAELLGKDIWKQYPVAMLKNRAITAVARDACEEVLFGLHYTPEELEDGDDGEPAYSAEQVADAVVRKEQADREQRPAASDPQRTKLILLMRDKLGVTDRDVRLRSMSTHLGREITTFNDITAAEAHGAIDALSKLPDYITEAETVPGPEAGAATVPMPEDDQDFHLPPSVGPEGICVDMEAAIQACIDKDELGFVGQRIKELTEQHVLHEQHLKRLDVAWRAKSAELTSSVPANGWSHERLAAAGLAP